MLRPRARLDADEESGVLRLAGRRHQVVLSSGGVWVRSPRRAALLGWDDVDQVQVTPARGGRARVEVFRRDGAVHSSGPYPRDLALRWMEGCRAAAAAAGRQPRPLAGGAGFGLPAAPPGRSVP